MRKPRTSEKTTAELLKEAAVKLFGRYGYEGTTVREIAKDAGVTAGQITANFGSKENLFTEIIMDVATETSKIYDPIIGEYEYHKREGTLTEEMVWELIERIIDIQMAFVEDEKNLDRVQLLNVQMFNDDLKVSAKLAQMTVTKIEDTLARLLTEVFAQKRYLHARTVSRAVNGAIVSFAEHPNLLVDEVLAGQHMPQAKGWMEDYLKAFVMDSLRSEAKRTEE